MDPTAALKELRERIDDYLQHDQLDADLDRLLDLMLSVDHWMSKGGFLPQQWTINRTT
jgi:hypothetical protein